MPFPAPKFPYANNDMATVDLFNYRKLYKDKVLTKETGGLEASVADIWYNRHLYGKINQKGDFIILREGNLVSYLPTENGETHLAVDFVSRAYRDMIETMKKERAFVSTNPNNSPYVNFTVKRAWTSVYGKYYEYMGDIYSHLANYLHENKNSNKIKNFSDFTDAFFEFYDRMDFLSAPMTLSGFVSSRLCPNRSCGLVLDISARDASNDRIKYNVFVNDENFEIFQHYAGRFGFVIDKNMPWRLLANLNSCYMRKMMLDSRVYYDPTGKTSMGALDNLDKKDLARLAASTLDQYSEQEAYEKSLAAVEQASKSDLKSWKDAMAQQLDNVFDLYYFKTYELDLKYLKNYLYQMYRSFISDSPYYEKYEGCSGSSKKIKKPRIGLDIEAESDYTSKEFWLTRYFEIRRRETRAVFSTSEINFIMFNAKKICAIYGENKALEFLNTKLKKRHKYLYTMPPVAPQVERNCDKKTDSEGFQGPILPDLGYNSCL